MNRGPLQLHVQGSERTLALAATAVVAGAAATIGSMVLPGGPVAPLADRFATGELLGWALVALVTGGLVFGARDRRPPILAAALVGSAALLGATPLACAAIGGAGAAGALLRQPGLGTVRVAVAALLGWATPGLLAAAALVDESPLGIDHPFPLASVVALWAFLAVGVPLIEAAGTALVLEPAQRIGPVHMVQRRLEPNTVLTALAVLGAMSYAAIGAAAALVLLLPAAAARVGFALHEDGRRAVSQTLAAMTVLPEWVGLVDAGHTDRVRDVVEQVAVDLRLDSRLRRDVVRAAELHELGHLDTGADRDDRGRVARSGAAVLEQAEIQDRVQRIVHATDPDRPVHARDSDVELGAAIVSTACELDQRARVSDVEEAARRVATAIAKAHRSAGAYL